MTKTAKIARAGWKQARELAACLNIGIQKARTVGAYLRQKGLLKGVLAGDARAVAEAEEILEKADVVASKVARKGGGPPPAPRRQDVRVEEVEVTPTPEETVWRWTATPTRRPSFEHRAATSRLEPAKLRAALNLLRTCGDRFDEARRVLDAAEGMVKT